MAREFRPVVRLVCGLLALGAVSLPVGCGSAKGHVSGKVTLADGKPLPGGNIIFYPQQGSNTAPIIATIKEDGTYDAPNVPVGPAKVAVNNADLNPNTDESITPSGAKSAAAENMPAFVKKKMPEMGPPKEAMKQMPQGGKPKPVGTYVPIDSKYAKPETSPLTYDVQRGDQTFDVKGIAALAKPKKK